MTSDRPWTFALGATIASVIMWLLLPVIWGVSYSTIPASFSFSLLFGAFYLFGLLLWMRSLGQVLDSGRLPLFLRFAEYAVVFAVVSFPVLYSSISGTGISNDWEVFGMLIISLFPAILGLAVLTLCWLLSSFSKHPTYQKIIAAIVVIAAFSMPLGIILIFLSTLLDFNPVGF